MIPFLTYPLALMALASLPALAAIYILRNRFRRRTVSSLLLWNFHVQSKAGGAKVHRLQLPLLFFLELLALVLAANTWASIWKTKKIRFVTDCMSVHQNVNARHSATSTRNQELLRALAMIAAKHEFDFASPT